MTLNRHNDDLKMTNSSIRNLNNTTDDLKSKLDYFL